MKRTVPVAILVALALIVAAGAVNGQVKKDAKSGTDRIDGTVQSMDKAKSTIDVRQSSGVQAVWHVAYTDKTKFTYRNGPGKLEDVKEGLRVIVLGKFDKNTLTATRIDIRTK